jgi:hypothetical protein
LKRDGLTQINPRASAPVPNCPGCLVETQQRRQVVGTILRAILLAAALMFPVFAGHAAETITVYKDAS